MMMSNKITVIYHAGCLDGLAAAYAAFIKFGHSATYTPMTYSTVVDPEDYHGHEVYVVDFSFTRDVYLKVLSVADSLVILDHHKTAHEAIGDLVHIDQTKSGAVLSWEYFLPDEPVPMLFKYVQDRDLWQFQYPETKSVCAYLYAKPLTLESFGDSMEMDINLMLTLGAILLEQLDQMIERSMYHVRMIKFLGRMVPIVNVPASITSEIGNRLALEHGMAIMYSDRKDHRLFSMRSAKDSGIDVSALAKVYGGGGHLGAAGFELHINDVKLDDFLHEIKYPDHIMTGREVYEQTTLEESKLVRLAHSHKFPPPLFEGHWLRKDINDWVQSKIDARDINN